MSLVRYAELATTPYTSAKLFSLKGTDIRSDLSPQSLCPDKHRPMYMADSYSSESYEKYFNDSPTDELVEPSSSSGISGNPIHPGGTPSYHLRVSPGTSMVALNPFDTSFMSMRYHDASQSNFGSDTLENQSPDSLDGQMRLKLQELERALLDDNDEGVDEEDVFGTAQSMEIDPEWADPIHLFSGIILHRYISDA